MLRVRGTAAHIRMGGDLADDLAPHGVEGVVEDVAGGGGLVREAQKRVVNLRVELVAQQGQKLMAQAVAGVGVGPVRRVLAVGLAAGLQVADDEPPRHVDERADDLDAFLQEERRPWAEGRQPLDARAAEDVKEHGLGPVVGVVGEGDPPGAAAAGHAGEERAAGVAGGLLDADAERLGLGPHVRAADFARQAETPRKVLDKRLVFVGGAGAQAVVQVGNDGRDGEVRRPGRALAVRGKLVKREEERDGIRPAADAHDDGPARLAPPGRARQEVVRVDCGADLFEKQAVWVGGCHRKALYPFSIFDFGFSIGPVRVERVLRQG